MRINEVIRKIVELAWKGAQGISK